MLLTTTRLDRNGIDGIAVIPAVVVCLAGIGRAGAPSGEYRFLRR
jgi:hypothetical protein